ncbi:MAG: TonB-dependent receptor [Phocaeicola sp.]|uniref:TonB-dependent receptor n=1 Tax=Phocaeicola sp. TaxID=2773926 RepID=UPI003F9F791F
MRLFLLFLFCSVGICYAADTYAQNTEFTINAKNQTVENVLTQIETKSDFGFFFNNKHIDLNRLVSFSVKNKTVYEILNKLFEGTDITYIILDKKIILTKKGVIDGSPNSTLSNQGINQNKAVKGKVVDSKGEPIIGANVLEKGTMNGTITDIDGNYIISVNSNAILVISYIGYKSEEIAVNGKNSLIITLAEDTEALDEVVVIGYGTQKKSNLTGSITSIKSKDVTGTPAKTITEALQGKVSGIYVNKGKGVGAGSNIFIRGAGSVNGLSPLYVIDGAPGGSSVGLNMNDIESIEVIKDASAAAIYGANAAGGVILITTKKGEKGKPRMDVSFKIGTTKATGHYNFLHTIDYINAKRIAVGEVYDMWQNPSSLPDTDWAKEMGLKGHGTNQQYTVSLSGASDRFNYYVSGQFQREDGYQKDYWQYFQGLVKMDYNITKNLKIGTRIDVSKTNYNPNTIGYGSLLRSISGSLFRSIPYISPYDDNGNYTKIPSGIEFSGDNWVAYYDHINHDDYGSNATDGRLFLDWEIIKGLKFNLTGICSFSSGYTDNYNETQTTRRAVEPDSYNKASSFAENYRFFATLTYDFKLGNKHEFSVMAGWEAGKSMNNSLTATAYGLPISDPKSFAIATSSTFLANGVLDKNGRIISQFGRLNYAFNDKYLLTANIRRDGSTKFGKNNRYGVFPSVSVGWKLSEEKFFKNSPFSSFINTIKPRFSWGILGNTDALANYTYQKAYTGATLHSIDGTTWNSGYTILKIINNDIKWEEIHNTDIGVDMTFFNNRLEFAFDWYKRNTKDMLYNLSMPLSSGIIQRNANPNSMPVNLGSVVNKGVEFSLVWRDKIGDFTYSISSNIAHNNNKVEKLGLDGAYIYDGHFLFSDIGASSFKTADGKPIGSVWGLRTDGLIKTQAEIDVLNNTAKAKGYNYYKHQYTGVGDLKYVDTNNDGHIDQNDCEIIGNPWPSIQYGGIINLSYKSIDLSANFVGVGHRDVVNFTKPFEYSFIQDYQSTYKMFKTSYWNGGGETKYPRVYATTANGSIVRDPNGNWKNTSDAFIEDAAYLKIKNITIGYTIPKKWIVKAGINNLRIYFTGNNLFTFTSFSGLDPEFTGSVTSYGLYEESTPLTKTYTIGVDINF